MTDLVDYLNALKPENIPTIFLFFVPGFIALSVGGFIGPTPESDFAKRIVNAVGISILNFAAMVAVLAGLDIVGLSFADTIVRFVFIFVLPILYPTWLFMIRNRQGFGFSTPFPAAWDQLFNRRLTYFIKARLKGDTEQFICGFFGEKSIASQSPADQQIYIQSVYDIDAAGNWAKRPDTAGVLVSMSELSYIEYIIPE